MTVQLDPRWAPVNVEALTFAQLKRNRKLSWWSIMAYEHGMVTAPEARGGRNEIACHLLPDIFWKPSQVSVVKDRVFPEELRLYWHQRVTPMKVRLQGRKNWTPVWVNTSSENVAEKLLKSKMPSGTSIASPD